MPALKQLCLVSSLVLPLAAQGYSSGFETYTASAAGTLLTGQDGYYIPVAGSLDWNVYTYAGNALNLPTNPNGGANFAAGVSRPGTVTFARTQRPLTLPGNGLVYVQYDILCNYVGTGTPTQYIGSFSFQPSATNRYVNLISSWTTLTPAPTTWDLIYVLGPTAAGTPTPIGDPAFTNLAVGVWHTVGTTIDLGTGYHVDFRIRNGTTNVWTVFTPPANTLPLPNQTAVLPTDFRFFAGGVDNLLAVDNAIISYGAGYSTFGTGCAGALGTPTLAASAATPRPTLGTTFTAQIGNLPLSLAIMLTGFSNTTALGGAVPLPFSLAGSGFPGCNLLVDPMATEFLVGSGGTANWNFTIPNVGAFAGLQLFNQGVSLEAGAPGLAFSNGGACVVGY